MATSRNVKITFENLPPKRRFLFSIISLLANYTDGTGTSLHDPAFYGKLLGGQITHSADSSQYFLIFTYRITFQFKFMSYHSCFNAQLRLLFDDDSYQRTLRDFCIRTT
jgi:hypothetical protein